MNGQLSARTHTRRRVLAAASVASAFGIAGCLGSESDETDLEVLHAWTGGAGERAIGALVDGFEDAHSDVETDFRPIAVGGETTYTDVVENRLEQNDPPSSFAGRVGRSLSRYDGSLGDVGDVWQDAGFVDAHAEEVGAACRYDDGFAAVPVGTHRGNALFYNVDVVRRAGVDPTTLSDPSDLIDALDRIDANTDATPLAHAMQDPNPSLRLFETVLLAGEGLDDYRMYAEERAGRTAVRSALETVSTIVSDYVGDDAGSVWSGTATERLLTGDAAFLQQDGRAFAEHRSHVEGAEDLTYGENWNVVPFPGTGGIFTLDVDSFVYPVDEEGENPTPDASGTWLRYVGGVEGQRLFNARKGSVPTRTDVDADEFGAYLSASMRDFEAAAHRPPSIAAGMAVDPDVLDNMERGIDRFLTGPHGLDSGTEGMLDAG